MPDSPQGQERIARLEGSVEAISKDVRELGTMLKDQSARTDRQITSLAESISEVANKQGRHDLKAMASWSGIVLTVCITLISFLLVLGDREAKEIRQDLEAIDAETCHVNLARLQEQVRTNAIIINLMRDRNYLPPLPSFKKP